MQVVYVSAQASEQAQVFDALNRAADRRGWRRNVCHVPHAREVF
jgi:hypothetical protein